MARRDTAARRYAEAAFEIGRADGTLAEWERDLLKLRDALAVMDRLHELTGDEIEINEVVDESLIGGITVRIGDQLYDASVRSRLERMRARLTAV
jgi:F0F1-type ATP synthase delta subunit